MALSAEFSQRSCRGLGKLCGNVLQSSSFCANLLPIPCRSMEKWYSLLMRDLGVLGASCGVLDDSGSLLKLMFTHAVCVKPKRLRWKLFEFGHVMRVKSETSGFYKVYTGCPCKHEKFQGVCFRSHWNFWTRWVLGEWVVLMVVVGYQAKPTRNI